MLTTQVVLLSDQGKIADAIADLLPSKFEVRRLDPSIFLSDQVLSLLVNDLQNADVTILNLSKIELDSTQLISKLQSFDIPIIVLHLYHQRTFAEAFLKMGAHAYLPINFYSEDLIHAIESVLKKDVFIAKNVF